MEARRSMPPLISPGILLASPAESPASSRAFTMTSCEAVCPPAAKRQADILAHVQAVDQHPTLKDHAEARLLRPKPFPLDFHVGIREWAAARADQAQVKICPRLISLGAKDIHPDRVRLEPTRSGRGSGPRLVEFHREAASTLPSSIKLRKLAPAPPARNPVHSLLDLLRGSRIGEANIVLTRHGTEV